MIAARKIEIRIAARSNEYFLNKLILEENILQCFKNVLKISISKDQYLYLMFLLLRYFKFNFLFYNEIRNMF